MEVPRRAATILALRTVPRSRLTVTFCLPPLSAISRHLSRILRVARIIRGRQEPPPFSRCPPPHHSNTIQLSIDNGILICYHALCLAESATVPHQPPTPRRPPILR